MISLVTAAAEQSTTQHACSALGIARATYYRNVEPRHTVHRRRGQGRKLNQEEKQRALDYLHEARFADLAVPQVHAQLLEESIYVCSERTMYRVLNERQEIRERRDRRRHPIYKIPRLVAHGPKQVWTWDISKIPGPIKRSWFHLYVILDIYSRFVVGWMLAHRESTELGKRLISDACKREGILADELIIHADRGSPMKAKPMEDLFVDLGIGKSHSRPRVSNDNPYSESLFGTTKEHMPEHFDSIAQARAFFSDTFNAYNNERKHVGLQMLTPATVHFGRVDEVLAIKQAALDEAYWRNPKRFPHGPPIAKRPPKEVWINKPDAAQVNQEPMPNMQESQPVPLPSDDTRRQPSGTPPKGVQAGVAPHISTQNIDVPLL